MKNLSVFAFIIFVTFASTAVAQEVRSITLDEAIDISLENNIDVRLSENEIERQESEYRQSRAELYPNLNASIGGSRQIGRQFDQATVAFDDFTTNNLNSSISTSVTIFDGFQNINELRSARLGRESAEERYQRTRESIIFETSALFLDVLLSQELLEIERENLEASRQQLEQVEAQVEVGMRPVVDQYSQESVVANNELSVIQSENSLNLNKLRLSRILQLDPLGEYDFVAPSIQEEELEVRDYDLSEMINLAMNNRSDIRASEMELQQTRRSLAISQAGGLPNISLSAYLSTAYRDQQRDVDPETGMPLEGTMPFNDQIFDANINRGMSFNVSIPIFNRRQTRNQVQQRQIDYRNAELQLEDLHQEVFLELQQAYNDYMGYAQELEATEKALTAAERAYETEQERYNVGSATLIELTNANNEYVQASSNRIQAMYRFAFQEKVLDFYLGRITEDVQIEALGY